MKLMRVEYYRCWPDHTWDTAFLKIPADTKPTDYDKAVSLAFDRLKKTVATEAPTLKDDVWRPCWVGYYAPGGE